jgi:antagonist of KipI
MQGGVQSKTILGSRSSLQPLVGGADLPCRAGAIWGRSIRLKQKWKCNPVALRVVDGPQAGWFSGADFYSRQFRVAESSNRIGVRLQGAPLPFPDREMVSEPVCLGSVQVTPDRNCIVLGVDGQTIGGYPKIAQVITADLDAVGQLRPGTVVCFVRVSLEEAAIIHDRRAKALARWVTRLSTTFEASAY